MIEVATIREAQAVPDAIHMHFTGSLWQVYQVGDTVPVTATPTEAELLSALRAAAKALVDAKRDEDVRFRALMLVVLDEINVIRSKLVPILTPRTMAQLKTAIATKIDAGEAD